MKKSPLKFLDGANEFFMYKNFTYILSFTPCTLFKVGGKASASSYSSRQKNEPPDKKMTPPEKWSTE